MNPTLSQLPSSRLESVCRDVIRCRVALAMLTASLLLVALGAPGLAQPLDPDATGILWVGTSAGIFKVEGTRLVSDPDQPGGLLYGGGEVVLQVPQPSSPTQLAVDPAGETLWAHTSSTLHALDFEGQSLFTVPLGISGPATDLAVNPADGSVWLATGSTVLHFDRSGLPLGSFTVSSAIVGLRPDAFNRVWVARSGAVTAHDVSTGAPILSLDLGKGKTTVADIDAGLWSWMLGPGEGDRLYVLANKGWRPYRVFSGGATPVSDWIALPSGQLALAWSYMTNGTHITDSATTIPNPLQSPALHIVADWGHAWVAGGRELARPFARTVGVLADPILVDLGSGVEVTALAANQPERTPPVLQQVMPPQGAWTRFNPPVFELSSDDPPGVSDDRVSGVDPTKAVIMRSNVWLAASCVGALAGSVCVLEDVVPEGQNSFSISMFDYAANQSSSVSRSVSVDSLPPSITITSPDDGASLADRLPMVEVSYSDVSSGVDIESLAFFANGESLDVSCTTQSTTAASCQPVAPFPGGAVVIEAWISDVAGSQAVASISITIDAEDTSAPILDIVLPEEGQETTSTSPAIDLSYVDQGTGIDASSLVLLVDGAVLDATCSQSGSLFSGFLHCVPASALSLGPKTIEATLSDLAGNGSGSAVRNFTIVPPFTDVAGQVVKPDGAAAAGAEVTVVGKGTSFTDDQGFFAITGVPVSTGERLTVTASLVGPESSYSTRIDSLMPVYGGVTDAGVLSLLELCAPRFSAAFDPPVNRLPGRVFALATFDDGSAAGPKLLAGGVSSVGVAWWTGGGWTMPWTFDGSVYDLVVFDDGSGPALYAGGSFTSIDGVAISRLARWNGATWEQVGNGFNDIVYELEVLDLGDGSRLYAAGDFTFPNGARVARWDGVSWTAVGGPLDNQVEALAAYDDGAGVALYAGGLFQYSGTVRLDYIAKLQDGAWSPVGGGMDQWVHDLETIEDGGASVLAAAGRFRAAGGSLVGPVAKWDGTAWAAIGGLGATFCTGGCLANDLEVMRTGAASQLFVGGASLPLDSKGVLVWDGSQWTPLPGKFVVGSVGTLLATDFSPTSEGPSLFLGGSFSVLGGVNSSNVGELHHSCDATPPVIVVTSPTNPAATTQSSVTFSGRVENGDVLYVGGQRLSLNVDGSFVSAPLSLADGYNAIALRALDDVGNQSEMVVQVLRDGIAPSIDFVQPAAGETVAIRRPEIEVAYRDDQLLDLATLTLRLNGSPVGMDCQRGGLGALCRPTEDLPTGSLTLTATVADLAGNVSPQAQRSFTVSASASPSSTTVVGSVRLPGGGPAVGAEVTALGQRGGSAIVVSDGSFLLSGVLATNGPVTVVARYQDASGALAGFVSNVTTVAGGTTDVGVIDLQALCDLELVDDTFYTGVGVDGTYPEKTSGGSDTHLSARVFALDVFDDGTGPALYVGGRFESAGGVPATGIARWDGQRWSHLDGGVKSGNVYALEVFDDGTGPALYVGGSFFRVGGGHDLSAGLSARGIARWNGTTWSVVGGSTNGTVRALASVTIGGSTSLYAGGRFTSVAGVSANHVARWDGQAWSALGSGLGGSSEGVYALAAFKAPKGKGDALYAGGDFEHTDMRRLAVWDGSRWAAAGGGVEANTASDFKGVWALTVFDGRLVVGGVFSKVGSSDLEAVCLAAWDGRTWSALPGLGCTSFQTFDTPTGGAQALAVYDDGTSEHLYALGSLNLLSDGDRSYIYRWDGSQWSSVAGGLAHGYGWNGMALATFDSDPSDSLRGRLFAGSGFLLAGPDGAVNANGLASWDGNQWSALRNGVPEPVTGLAVLDSGSGRELYVAGYTTDKRFPPSWQPFKPLRWDGGSWLSLPQIETSEAWEQSGHDYAKVEDLAALDDGSGMAVFAVGEFQRVGPWSTPGVAKWDGGAWVPYPSDGLPAASSLDPSISWNAVGMFDGGEGPRLVVAGKMNGRSGVVEWTGSSWRFLGEFFDKFGNPLKGFDYADLAVFADEQGQPSLFVAGDFASVDGEPIAFLARWDGSSWSAAGDFDAAVNGLAVFDDGSGAALYATGYFQNVDGRSAKYVARWDGTEWQPVGAGLPGWGMELGVADDGAGERLFVGGQVEVLDGQLGSGLTSWDGASWRTIATGIGVSANRIVGFDDGTGPAVFIGGGAWYPSMNYLKKFQRPLSCAAGPDTTPPALAFISPASGASVFTARPELGFSYSDSGSGVDTSTLVVKANGLALPVTCSYLVAEATCAPAADLPNGSVTLSATIMDGAGNVSTTAQVAVTVLTGPPSLAITSPTVGSILQIAQPTVELAYTENADTATLDLQSSPQTVAFSCNATATAASCTPLSPLAEGSNTLTATVLGFDGSPASPAQVSFTIDLSPPSLAFTAPADGSVVNQDRPELRLSYGDAGTGVDPSTLRIQEGGVDVPVACTSGPAEATCTPTGPLAEGAHTLTATVADFAGRVSTPAQVSFEVGLDFAGPVIALASPQPDALTTAPDIRFTGSLDESATLTLNGAAVALDAAHAFDHGPVALAEGWNRFELVATDAVGNVSSQSVRVLRDSTPPALSFIAPTEGAYFDPSVQPFELRWGDSGTGIDPATLQLTADGSPLEVVCTACGSGATCTTATPPAGSVITLEATVADGLGLTALARVTFTTDPNGDFVAPQIDLTAPVSGRLTNESEQRFIGQLSEPATLTIAGAPATVGANLRFDHSPVLLTEGSNAIELRASDAAGNVGTLTVILTLDSTPPPPVDTSLVTVGSPAGGQVTVSGEAGSVMPVEAGQVVRVENRFSASASEAVVAGDGSFTAALAAVGGDELALFVRDTAGNRSVGRLLSVPGTPTLPPDPSAVAPALDPTAATGPCQLYEFLYTGAAPIQAGVAADGIDCRGASLLRGRVLDRAGQPVSGVRISVLRGAELGSTLTRGDGVFDFVVPGGSEVVLQFHGAGHLPVHRKVSAPYGASTTVPDVVLTALDAVVTTVDSSGGATTMQVARGSAATDADGTRRATLLFPAGATARLRYTGGAVETVASLAIRATEYTVGPEGPAAMPAALPPTSAYTYAVELSADEALATGAAGVELDRPVLSYTENFLGLPTGVVIPVGYYDRELGRWVAEENGRVIEILSSTDGLADLDVDGTGAPADATRLAELGITDAERTELVTLYSVGQSLWRVRLSHFTPYDYNLPFYPPPGAASPSQPKPRGADQDKRDDDCLEAGSIIECTNQILGEEVGILGAPYTLNYRSDRVPGRGSARTLEISLSGGSPPASAQRIDLTVDIAGKQLTQGFTPGADLSHSFTWDGLDAFGRTVQGATEATVSVGYVYDATYARPPEDELDAFARAGTSALTGNPARDEITLWQRHRVEIGGWDALAQVRLGGWTLSPHHAYDPHSRTLYYGDGGRRTVKDLTVITSAAGTGEPGFAGDGGPADEARLSSPNAIVLSRDAAGTPDGGYYLADSRNCRVRHVNATGVITTVAGSGCRYAENGLNSAGASGDGGPATAATLHWNIGQIAQGPDGSLYISDAGHFSIRRVTPDGIINTVIGYDWFHGAEPGPTPPTQLQLIDHARGLTVDDAGDIYVGLDGLLSGGVVYRFAYPIYEPEIFLQGKVGEGLLHYLRQPHHLAFDIGGNLFIADGFSSSIFRRGWDGSFTEQAGGCQTLPGGQFTCTGDAGDGGPATDALLNRPIEISFAADGSVLFVDSGNHRVRRIDSMGRISTVAGTGAPGFNGDGRAARQTQLSSPVGLEILPDGDILIADADNNRIRRIEDVLPPLPQTGLILVPEEDGQIRYVFDLTGRHLRTEDARTGQVLITFAYAPEGYLSAVADSFGNTTTIERDAAGAPDAIVAPFGQRTELTVHSSGYLATIANPAGESLGLSYTTDGLLTGLVEPRSNAYVFEYDALGRLQKDTDPAGGSTTLARSELAPAGDVVGGFVVTQTTALDRTTTYRTEQLASGQTRRTTTDAAGSTTTSVESPDGTRTTISPDGTVASAQSGPDPRFDMQAPRLQSLSVTTPGGLTSTTTTSRTATFVNPTGDRDDPANLATVTDTVTVNGKTAVSIKDMIARHVTATSPEGREMSTEFDVFGRLTERRIAGLAPANYSYDAAGRLRTVTQGARTTTYAYDSATGFLSSVTDPASRSVSYTYDAAGRMVTQTLPDHRVVGFAYDASGNLASVRPPARSSHVFGHTPVGQVSSYGPPDVGLNEHGTVVTYDLDGQIDLVTRPDGQTIDSVFDPASGRLTSVVTPRGSHSYTYDATTGRLSTITDSDGGSLAFGFDGSLLTSVTWAGEISGAVGFGYDNDFNVVSRSINESDPVSFSYDRDGLVTGAGDLILGRNPATGLLSGSSLQGVTDSYSYDATYGELTGYSASEGGTELYAVSYSREETGRILQKVETLAGVTTRFDYVYDAAGRLTDVDQNDVNVAHYEYDENSNRIAWSDYWGSGAATYDEQDRLVDYAGTTYTYTANGELASKGAAGSTVTYDYDTAGNLRTAVLADGLVVDYLVDAANRRIGKKVGGTLVQGFLYEDQINPAAELDGSGAVVSTFVYASKLHVPDFMVKGGTEYRLLTDHLGSVRLVVDATTGAVAQRLDYGAFGRITLDTNPGFQPFGYAGGLYDRHTGLVRFGARDYDPETGRWTSKDPMGFGAGDTNLYGYVLSDPINSVDPLGLFGLADTPEWLVSALESVSDFSAGFGDFITVGGTRWARRKLGWDHMVDPCSGFYRAGEVAGFAHGLATGGVGSLSAGARSVFYSGKGALQAAQAGKGSGILLSETLGGRLLNGIDRKLIQLPDSAWRGASWVYAANAKGTAQVFTRGVLRPGSVYSTTEFPTLVQMKNARLVYR